MQTIYDWQELGMSEIADSNKGTLPLQFRYDLWKWMDDHYSYTSHERRVALNILVVDNIAIPKWNTYYGRRDELNPEIYLALCRDFLHGLKSQRQIETFLRENSIDLFYLLERDVNSTPEEIERANAGYAMLAAQAGAWVTAYDENCLEFGLSESNRVFQNDADLWDAHFICSAIAANGTEWESSNQIEDRRAYWERWLMEWLVVACSDRVRPRASGN